MSKYPWTWTTGVRPLRASIYNALHLPAEVGEQIGVVNTAAEALKSGADVTLPTSQLVGLFSVSGDADRPWSQIHPSLPDILEDHDAWVLSGDDTLTPVTS